MTTKTIKVTAGRTFNHPHEQYSNLRPEVAIEAVLTDGEDVAAAVRTLQQQAEGLVEDHKQNLLKSIEELYQLSTRQAEMRGLQRELERVSSRLEEVRKLYGATQLGNGEMAEDPPKEIF